MKPKMLLLRFSKTQINSLKYRIGFKYFPRNTLKGIIENASVNNFDLEVVQSKIKVNHYGQHFNL